MTPLYPEHTPVKWEQAMNTVTPNSASDLHELDDTNTKQDAILIAATLVVTAILIVPLLWLNTGTALIVVTIVYLIGIGGCQATEVHREDGPPWTWIFSGMVLGPLAALILWGLLTLLFNLLCYAIACTLIWLI